MRVRGRSAAEGITRYICGRHGLETFVWSWYHAAVITLKFDTTFMNIECDSEGNLHAVLC